ncbi:anthranilate synthase component I family protein [Pareuzebyella sediminis]|uniref:anthranilate synthase component I family protein n=1 Tax=Pareuzebyella sediminis TaxID=2607998 RepID=UPI0011EFA68F|nr:anthranilate synthase component I family protein [Pareuzebyella sediminis]
MRITASYKVSDTTAFKRKLLEWAQSFDEVVWFDSNGHRDRYYSFDTLLAVDALTSFQTDFINGFDNLKEYQSATKDWIFGYLTYDLKNDIERLSSGHTDRLKFPEIHFFQPKKVIRVKDKEVLFDYLNIVADEIQTDYEMFLSKHSYKTDIHLNNQSVKIKMGIFKDEYFRQVKKMLVHIHRGDIYEANFCQEFYAENTRIDALKTYQRLNSVSKAPFATFLKLHDKYLISASPERYLKKRGTKIISQPIKGTARRSDDIKTDRKLKLDLQESSKERAENIMIVDLVRNDLSKSARRGTVEVEELCGVYSFAQVHQMISTVVARVEPEKNIIEILKETFPMGSMTGAPKVSAMKIIERLEAFKRGLYSGSVGYIDPKGDFDFNVVIRSILYNDTEKYVSFPVGSAITALSNPESEYEECLLKARAMRDVLENG